MSIKIDLKSINGSSQNLQSLANEPPRQPSYAELKKEYELRKQEFDKWCDDNRNAAGSAPYENYIRDFKNWELQMLRQIEQASKQGPDDDDDDSDPEGDLETQLRKALEKCDQYQFTLALLHAKTVDPSLFNAICKGLDLQEDVGIGQVNKLNPINMRTTLAANPPKLYSSPVEYSPKASPSPAYSSTSSVPRIPKPVAPFVVPAPRQIMEEQLPPPPRTYAEKPKLPFFDIGGSRS